MDPETARVLFDEGATVVFLDVPQNTEVGIDMNVWRTGEKFKGLKMIPPGLHLLHYSAVGKEGIAAPRTSSFHVFEHGEVFIRKWDRASETLVEASGEEEERIKNNKEELDRFLGAFPYETWKKWYSLASCVSEELIKRVQPLSGTMCSVAELEPDGLSEEKGSQSSPSSEEKMLPRMHLKPGTELRLTELPSIHCLEGTSPELKTKYSIDSSHRLETMLKKVPNPKDLLGELQVVFISFLICHVYDSFEHWKKLLHMFCTCDDALKKHPDFFLKLLSCLHYQIEEVPEDFFTDIMSRENFLVHTLQILFSNLEDEDVAHTLKQRGALFKKHLVKKFKWDFSEEPEDYAPVVVETD